MSQEFVKKLLGEQRRRTVATLMYGLEADAWPHLPPDVQAKVRERVISGVGNYHDLCLDVLKASTSDHLLVNEEAVALLEQIHESLARLQTSVDEID